MTKHISTPMEINIVDLKVMMKVKKIAIVHINLAHKLLWIPLIITALFFGSTQIFLLLLTCSMGKMFGVKRQFLNVENSVVMFHISLLRDSIMYVAVNAILDIAYVI